MNIYLYRTVCPEEQVFHLLHLSMMREYIDFEFSSLKETLSFPYNLENIIDDWVLMGFLVGNDFIPHLPHMHINDNALVVLYSTYIKVMPKLDGKLTFPRFLLAFLPFFIPPIYTKLWFYVPGGRGNFLSSVHLDFVTVI